MGKLNEQLQRWKGKERKRKERNGKERKGKKNQKRRGKMGKS